MSGITTHVLDTAAGRPAAGLEVVLERETAPGRWEEISRGVTDTDGRIDDFGPAARPTPGTYRLRFETGSYFARGNIRRFFPEVAVAFTVSDPAERYHVPLLLSPFGYSTYRGS